MQLHNTFAKAAAAEAAATTRTIRLITAHKVCSHELQHR